MGKINFKDLSKYLETTLEEQVKHVNITDQYVAFLGGVFSNFYPCEMRAELHFSIVSDKFDYNNRLDFISSEQYFMWQKAMYFGDGETAEKILKAETPMEAKNLGRKVKNFNEEEWAKVRYDAMFEAVICKFKQNESLKEILLANEFKDKHFVEGNPHDKIWAVGLDWKDERIGDENNWNGLNLLGRVLDDVRDYLTPQVEIPW